jgi:hypothetical protein
MPRWPAKTASPSPEPEPEPEGNGLPPVPRMNLPALLLRRMAMIAALVARFEKAAVELPSIDADVFATCFVKLGKVYELLERETLMIEKERRYHLHPGFTFTDKPKEE